MIQENIFYSKRLVRSNTMTRTIAHLLVSHLAAIFIKTYSRIPISNALKKLTKPSVYFLNIPWASFIIFIQNNHNDQCFTILLILLTRVVRIIFASEITFNAVRMIIQPSIVSTTQCTGLMFKSEKSQYT